VIESGVRLNQIEIDFSQAGNEPMTKVPNQGTALVSCANKAIKAEARACATLRENGTAPASGYPRAGALLPKVRTAFEDAHGFRKCASWKTPVIPSKMRTLFQGAHQKLSIFEEWSAVVPRTPERLNRWEFTAPVHKLRCSLH
jgi:hypothetical protein